ncbi:MAG: hypothetical protein JWN36_201 [Microbacteriaceae bacterium]|jgi:hypothetical protein|nr:hypothetical protein [Microbacteriaceae bacterium]
MAAELKFACLDAVSEKFAAGPTLNFKLAISESTGERVHAIALRVQIRIEPEKRRYSAEESARLDNLFGDPSRYADTLKPLQFAFANVMVPSFTGSTEVELPVPCTYDLETASTSYFHGLLDGEIPLLLLFSGTVFTKGANGFSVAQIPWSCEAEYRLPVAEWRLMMDRFLPNGGWLRVSRETLDALGAFKNARALPTWEHAIDALLDEVSETAEPPS